MLLKMEDLMLLRVVDVNSDLFEALPNLTKEQKKRLLGIDEFYFYCEGEHMIVNYKDLMESDEIVAEDGEIVPRGEEPSARE